MTQNENIEQNQGFPKLELLPEFQEITSLTKDGIENATNHKKHLEGPSDFSKFDLDWSEPKIEETPEQKKQKELEFRINNKIIEIFEQNSLFKDKYNKLISKYIDKSTLLKLIFINIWVINNSGLQSKDRFVNDLFLYLETENLGGYENYLGKLFGNRENRDNRAGFPKDVYTSMFALKDLFENIFIQKIDIPADSKTDMWNDAGGGRAR